VTTVDHSPTPAGTDVVDRLMTATNAHDLDALVDCFADDYVLTDPAHPARGFTGREQVRRNWATIFGGVPDVVATVRARVDAPSPGDPSARTTWLELAMAGTRRDGAAHEMVGVMVFEVRGDRIVGGRFFLEPVDHTPVDADAAVRSVATGTRP
jgi:ketosteroid isomerase-like protein